MKKVELRKLYKEKRKNVSKETIKDLQEKIYEQFFMFDFSTIKTIHVFLPIKKHKEINTYPIIKFLRKLKKTIVISKSDFKTNTLTHFLFDTTTLLEINDYEIPEPINAKEINAKEIDLVVVPLLISDKKNFRVGYGKGFYDRFLSECRNDIKTIGLSFFKPINKIEDINKYDIALQHIIYPKT